MHRIARASGRPGLHAPRLGGYQRSTAFLLGNSPSGTLGTGLLSGNLTTDMGVGRNILDYSLLIDPSIISLGTYDAGIYADDSAAGSVPAGTTGPNLISPDETYLQGGDSGGPSFVEGASGELLLIGIHSFIGTADFTPDPDRRLSGDTFLPSYRGTILAAIPEPMSIFLLTILVALSSCRRRRRSR